MGSTNNQLKQGASIQNKIVKAIKADPKKTGVLTLLVAVLLVMWMRLWSGNEMGPAQAIAAAQTPASLAKGSFGNQGEIHEALKAWKATEIPVVLGRNLFAAKLEYFPGDTKADAVPTVATVPDGFWDHVEKSLLDQADQKREQRVLIDNLQNQLSSLRLQSTMMGARPKAVIDGELVGVGDLIASSSGESRTEFRVIKIEARRVIVEREGIKLEIPMK